MTLNTIIAGADQALVKRVVEWIGKEMIIYNTPFCYKSSRSFILCRIWFVRINKAACINKTQGLYDRGVGTVPNSCPSGKNMRASLCYDSCQAGFSDKGTLTCTKDCPSGYTDTGLLCHYNGRASYVPSTRWDGCKSRAPWWLGGGCVGGLSQDGCSDNYNYVAGVCWIKPPPGFSGSGLVKSLL